MSKKKQPSKPKTTNPSGDSPHFKPTPPRNNMMKNALAKAGIQRHMFSK